MRIFSGKMKLIIPFLPKCCFSGQRRSMCVTYCDRHEKEIVSKLSMEINKHYSEFKAALDKCQIFAMDKLEGSSFLGTVVATSEEEIEVDFEWKFRTYLLAR
ncbi:hypothetical protein MXB_4864 [Myxobolus squamalis]|nr:hypothetical protein MXB_4864 [Myxobolus squamalis]